MGKLGDLWQQLKDLPDDDPRVPDIQKEINRIEQWMIDNGYKDDEPTKFGSITSELPHYPHHTGFVRFEDIKLLAEYNGLGINYNSDGSIHNCQKCENP